MNQSEPPPFSSYHPPSSPAAADAIIPNQHPVYVDRHSISKLLQPHLVLLSLQDSRILHQPIILTATCYQSINQIIDQIILSILHAISTPHHSHALIDLPLEHHHLQSRGIRQVLSGSLAQQSIQAAELAWTVYQTRRVHHSSQPNPHQPAHSIPPSDLFLQLQIDCQILSPYATTHNRPWLNLSAHHTHTPQPNQNRQDEDQRFHTEPIKLLHQSLDLLLDPNDFNVQLECYHQLFNTVNLSLRQHHPDAAQTVLQHRLTIYFLGFIQAFTNYLLKVILSIVETRLPYPSAIQAHQLVGFIAQDNQIVNFWNILQVIQSKSSLTLLHFPHSTLSSPYHSLEPRDHLPKKKSLTLKPLLLTPRSTNSKLGPSSPLSQISPAYASTTSLPTGNSFDLTHPPASTPPSLFSHLKQSGHLTPNPIYGSLDLPFHSVPRDQSFARGSHTSPNSPTSSITSPQYIMYSNNSHVPRSAPMSYPGHSATQSHPSINTYQNPLSLPPCPATDKIPVRPNRHTFGQALAPTPLAASEPHAALQPFSHCHDDGRANLEPVHFKFGADSSRPISPSSPARSPLSSAASSGSRSPHPSYPARNSSGEISHPVPSQTSHSFDLPLHRSRPRSRSWTTMLSSQVASSVPSTSSNPFSNVHLQQQSEKPKSLKQGLSGGSNTRISFEQLMRSNETVKFSLTPSPCLDDSPMSPLSSKSSDGAVVSPRGLADPIAIQPDKRLPATQLLPRFELHPRARHESSDTLELSPACPIHERFSSPSSNVTSSSSMDSHIDLGLPPHTSAQKIPKQAVTSMSSMSQRIAAARTPDLNSNSSFQRRPQLQSLTDILNSDPPWLNPKGNTSRSKPLRSDDIDFQALSLTTPRSIQSDAWNADQYTITSASQQSSLAGKSSLEPLISHRTGHMAKGSDNDFTPRVATRSQTGDSQASGLQKTLRGFKSMITRRKKGREDPQGSIGSSKSSYWKGTDWYTNSISSRNESFDQTKSLSALEQSPTALNDQPFSGQSVDPRVALKQSIKSNLPTSLDSNSLQISYSEDSSALATAGTTFKMPPEEDSAKTFRPDLLGEIPSDFVDSRRSKLGRSMSMTSLMRRPNPPDSVQRGASQAPKSAARSKKSLKSRTLTDNSNSSGNSGGTVTHSRSRLNSSAGPINMSKKSTTTVDEKLSDLDEIMALAARLNRRFRGPSFEHKRAQSVDSLQLPRTNDDAKSPNPQSHSFKPHQRLETGSSMNSDFEISVAQEFKPASINRIFISSPNKNNHHHHNYPKSDDNGILNSYYDSSSQSTAIDEDIPNMKESIPDENDPHAQKQAAKLDEHGRGIRRSNDVLVDTTRDDEVISLDQLRTIVCKLNTKIDELLAHNHYQHQPTPLGITRVELLKMIVD